MKIQKEHWYLHSNINSIDLLLITGMTSGLFQSHYSGKEAIRMSLCWIGLLHSTLSVQFHQRFDYIRLRQPREEYAESYKLFSNILFRGTPTISSTQSLCELHAK